MLFNSLEFAIFFLTLFVIYWQITSVALRNVFLLTASYVFYGWWDYRFLGLILLSSCVDFSIALAIERSDSPRRRWWLLCACLCFELGMVGFFKYFNFFIEEANTLLLTLGFAPHLTTLQIILPVGISFYTFQTLSYVIDVYRRQMPAEYKLINFLAYVSFFPQLVAGPIERATNLLPQFRTLKQFSEPDCVAGLKQILWGLFKKVAIADRCAPIVDRIFDSYTEQSSPLLAVGAVLFAFQIYGDFSGYSDIAIGVARMLGFRLMRNFNYPYFSRDIAEFWRRWHISLSTWFRDYVYLPLGGSRAGRWRSLANIFVVFLLSGFWHGANWTFIAWGFMNALYFVPLYLAGTNRRHLDEIGGDRWWPTGKESLQILGTFTLISIAWVFFRAESIDQAFDYLTRIAGCTFRVPGVSLAGDLIALMPLMVFFLMIEWHFRHQQFPFERPGTHPAVTWVFSLLTGVIVLASGHLQATFIYFQF
ncbi:MAG: MBOAT family protein [Planctomycetaceae bacterium]|nr:MBOAT family protein [Planctomycetaceae bacterium]